jgi:hypothetical protein
LTARSISGANGAIHSTANIVTSRSRFIFQLLHLVSEESASAVCGKIALIKLSPGKVARANDRQSSEGHILYALETKNIYGMHA